MSKRLITATAGFVFGALALGMLGPSGGRRHGSLAPDTGAAQPERGHDHGEPDDDE
jgi:hypothetical protein